MVRLTQRISIFAVAFIIVGITASTSSADTSPKWVVFEGTTNAEYSDWGIWVSRMDGSDAHEITSDAESEGSPSIEGAALSPDGLEVAYLRYEYVTKENCIEVMSVNGGRAVVAYCGLAAPRNLTWSPNGYELAFNMETKQTFGEAIFVLNLRSEALRRVADWKGHQRHPTFSPDGSQLAFESPFNPEGELSPGIYVVDSNGESVHQLTDEGETNPAWSPDGSQIAVGAYDESSPVEDEGAIALINSTTGVLERWLLSEDGFGEYEPEWDPAGESIFFTRCIEGDCSFNEVNLVGAEEHFPLSEFYELDAAIPQETTGSIEPELNYLLQRYAPRLHYDIQEQYFADSAAEATDGPENRILASNKETVLAAHELGYPTPSLSLLAEPAYANGYIDEGSEYAQDAADMHSEPQYANKSYGRVFEDPATGTLWLDYWYYYYYDSQEVLGIGVHEGDWETIALRLNEEDIPDLALYSRHATESAACESADVEWEVTNPSTVSPVSYVANGSHANYFTAGEHGREFPLPTDDANGDGAIVTPEVAEVESAAYNSATALPRWIYWTGKWGASGGEGIDQESPSGPARNDDRWENLQEFAEESASNCEVSGSMETPRDLQRGAQLPQPETPAITARESKGGIVIRYRVSMSGPTAKYLLLSVSAKNERDATRTMMITLTAPTGKARLARPLAAGPYVAAASTFTARKERSHTAVVDVVP